MMRRGLSSLVSSLSLVGVMGGAMAAAVEAKSVRTHGV